MKTFWPFLLFITLYSCIRTDLKSHKCENPVSSKKCPEHVDKIFFPRNFPAKSIYLGFNSDENQINFINLMINKIKNSNEPPKLNILVPRIDEDLAYNKLNYTFSQKKYEFLNIIQTSSFETVWAQDYFEQVTDLKKRSTPIIDLPYIGREGEHIPYTLALVCQKEIIPQAHFSQEELPSNGDYGGNILPITTDLLLVGNNISQKTYNVIKAQTSQTIIDIEVDWLETGHVDELITVLPHKKNAQSCEQSLFVSSPKLALELIDKNPATVKSAKSFVPYFDNSNYWPEYSHCLKEKLIKTKECINLRKANIRYQTKIDKSVETIQSAMQEKHGCKLKVENIPQLFLPYKLKEVFKGNQDRAAALNPNSVNNIYFNGFLMIAKQELDFFQAFIENILKNYPFQTTFLDNKFINELNGGLHCATNILYGCF